MDERRARQADRLPLRQFQPFERSDLSAHRDGCDAAQGKFEYDAVGRIKKQTDTANRETIYEYDDAARTNTVTNPELEVTTTKHNARNQMIEVKDALNQVYAFTYNPFGQVLTQPVREQR